MAFVLYFFSIEVLVSYLNKVISKSGTVHSCFWKGWVVSTFPHRGIQFRVRAVRGPQRGPAPRPGLCGVCLDQISSAWFPPDTLSITRGEARCLKFQVFVMPPAMSTLNRENIVSVSLLYTEELFVETGFFTFAEISSKKVAYFLQ